MRNRLFNFLIISKIFIFYQINAQTWTQIFSNQSKNLNAVEFANDSIGWIMGNDGIILYTNNSGNSWSTQTSGTTKNLMDLHVFNKDTVVAVGEDAVFIYTLNGGTSWTVQTVNMNYGGSFNIDYFYAIHGHNEVANSPFFVGVGGSGSNPGKLFTSDINRSWKNASFGDVLGSAASAGTINDVYTWSVGSNSYAFTVGQGSFNDGIIQRRYQGSEEVKFTFSNSYSKFRVL